MKTRLTILVGLLAALHACSSGGGTGDGGTGVRVPFSSYGGMVVVQVDDGSALYGTFLSAVTTTGDFVLEATDECAIAPAEPPSIVGTYRDVGPDIRARAGAAEIVAARESLGEVIEYLGYSAGGAANSQYTIEVGGTAIGSVDVPFGGSVPAELPAVVPGEPFVVPFEVSAGVELAFIDVESSDGTVQYTCAARADGSFTIPPEVTSAVGSGAWISAEFLSISTAVLDGRTVVLVGYPGG